MQTNKLTGAALDWAVHYAIHGTCEGYSPHEYSNDWAQGGPIIEREKIDVMYEHDMRWLALPQKGVESYGPTPLIAAMRCYVASKMGDDIELSEELK